MIESGFLLLGVVAGILSGLFGIGGGIVMVPSLLLIFGMDILDANATSLAAMLLPVGILGVLAYRKAGLLNLKDAMWIALGLFVGSFAGGELAVHTDEALLGKLYVLILLYVAVNYLDIPNLIHRKKAPRPVVTHLQKPVWAFLLVGAAAGVFAGLFGKGGGIVIVPMLVGMFGYEPKKAAATSLAALQLPVGLPSVLIYAQDGHLNVWHSVFIAIGILFGALAGSHIGVRLPSAVFRKVFAVFLLVVAVYMMFR